MPEKDQEGIRTFPGEIEAAQHHRRRHGRSLRETDEHTAGRSVVRGDNVAVDESLDRTDETHIGASGDPWR